MNTLAITAVGVAAVTVALLFVVRWAIRSAKREGEIRERQRHFEINRKRSKRAADIAGGPVASGEKLRARVRARRLRKLRQAGQLPADPPAAGDE